MHHKELENHHSKLEGLYSHVGKAASIKRKTINQSLQEKMGSLDDLYFMCCRECFSMDRIFDYNKYHHEILQCEFCSCGLDCCDLYGFVHALDHSSIVHYRQKGK